MTKPLSEFVRIQIIALRNSGHSMSKIANQLKVSKKSVSVILKRWREEETIRPRRRLGPKSKLTASDKRHIAIHAKQNPKLTRQQLKDELNLDVSLSIISKALKEHGLKCYVARKKPLISEKNRKARLDFAKKYIGKPISFWKKVLFTDESRFAGKNDGRTERIIRQKGRAFERGLTKTTVETNVMMTVWGAMGYISIGKLVKIDGIMDAKKYMSILDEGLLPSVTMNGWTRQYTLQMDNDPKHTSKAAMEYYKKHQLNLLPWPSQSPDLNPIEHLWDEVSRRMKGSSRLSQKQYEQKVMDVWSEISSSYIQKLINSMPRRLAAVMKAKGGNTRY